MRRGKKRVEIVPSVFACSNAVEIPPDETSQPGAQVAAKSLDDAQPFFWLSCCQLALDLRLAF